MKTRARPEVSRKADSGFDYFPAWLGTKLFFFERGLGGGGGREGRLGNFLGHNFLFSPSGCEYNDFFLVG